MGNPFADTLAGQPQSLDAMAELLGLQTIAGSGTILTGSPYVRATAAGNVASIVMQPGQYKGQTCYVCNESAFTLTMAAAATSNVRKGTGAVLPANSMTLFIWDGVSRWECNLSA